MQKHELQMAALARTILDICQTPQQTAKMNPSHSIEKNPAQNPAQNPAHSTGEVAYSDTGYSDTV